MYWCSVVESYFHIKHYQKNYNLSRNDRIKMYNDYSRITQSVSIAIIGVIILFSLIYLIFAQNIDVNVSNNTN